MSLNPISSQSLPVLFIYRHLDGADWGTCWYYHKHTTGAA